MIASDTLEFERCIATLKAECVSLDLWIRFRKQLISLRKGEYFFVGITNGKSQEDPEREIF